MTQDWTVESPKVLDIGEDGERVGRLVVDLVRGQVDVVTHDDAPAAQVEVHEVEGQPLVIAWDGQTLRVSHVPVGHQLAELWEGHRSGGSLIAGLKAKLTGIDRNRARVSISVPRDCRVQVRTVSATALVSGVRAAVSLNTVSGALSLDDVLGDLDVNTVSGEVECRRVSGQLRVNTVSGSVTAQQSDLPSVRISTVSGDVALDLSNPAASISSNSVSGDVTVRAPYDGYDVTGATATGDIVADGRTLPKSGMLGRFGMNGRVHGGDGALQLKASAVSGNIVLLRQGDAPAGDGVEAVAP